MDFLDISTPSHVVVTLLNKHYVVNLPFGYPPPLNCQRGLWMFPKRELQFYCTVEQTTVSSQVLDYIKKIRIFKIQKLDFIIRGHP